MAGESRRKAGGIGPGEDFFQTRQMLQLVLDTIPQRVFWKDLDGVYEGSNVPAARDAGWDRPEDLIGRTDEDMLWHARADMYRADDRAVMESGVAKIGYDEPQIRPDGTEGWSHTSKLPLRDSEGRVIGVLGIYEDVTERKRSEEALRLSEERYRHIIETTNDYVFSVAVANGHAGNTTHGPGSVAVTGYTPEELSGDMSRWLDRVVPSDRSIVADQLQQALASHQTPPLEYRIVRKDEAIRWVRSTLVPRFDASGATVALDSLIQDVTELRQLQEQLLEAQKMEGIGRLAGGVAHDFNNLLTAILGYLELARLDLPPDLPADHPIRSDLHEIGIAGERAANLTRQLLTFASKQIVTPVRLDLSELVADLLKILRPLLGESVTVETALEPGIGCIEADPGQIQQLLVNLAVNAHDAMPKGGRFAIETSTEEIAEGPAQEQSGLKPGPHVVLTVSDTGCGMTEHVRAHLFEPFFTTKERGKGTGLGLATCHGIVRQMGGSIKVFSEEGKGTTFRILLPVMAGVAELGPDAHLPDPTPSGNETILIVEDEQTVRRLVSLGLRAQGYTVLEAENASAAMEVLERLAPQVDVVVSDVVMPGSGGPELMRRVREVAPRARRLLVSGHAESMVEAGGPAEDDVAFLPKPFTPGRLARKIREILDTPTGGPARRPRRR